MIKFVKKYWGILIASFLLLGVVYIMSSRALWLGDDINYRYHFKTGQGIESVIDAFTSQVEHYKVMNGRFLAHFLVQIFIALLGKTFFSIVNACIYIVFLILIAKLSGIKLANSRFVILAALLILFSFQTKFVPSCQIGYIWMFTIVLLFIYLFLNIEKVPSRWHSTWLLPLSIIAGWTQEAIVVGISVALIIYVLSNFKKLTFNQWTMFFAFGLGAMLLCFSPGTLSRTNELHGSVDFLPPVVYGFVKFLFYLRMTYVFIGYILYLVFVKKISIMEVYRRESFLIVSLMTLIIFNLVVGVFGNRQLFGIELLSLILFMRCLLRYSLSTKLPVVMIAFFACWAIYSITKNTTFLKYENAVYEYLLTEYRKSEDGVVYYDLSSKDVTFYETYPCDVFTPFVLTTLSRYLNSEESTHYPLRVYPTSCQDMRPGNYFVENAYKAFSVVVDKTIDLPDRILQKRNLQLGPINVPFKVRDVTNLSPIFEDDSHRVYQLFDKMPFIVTTEVTFLYD